MNYLQSKIQWEEIEELGMEETYFTGMKFFSQICGNAEKNSLLEIHYECLGYLNEGAKTTKDFCYIYDTHNNEVISWLTKLTKLGLAYSFKEKKVTYYNITPLGKQTLYREVNRLIDEE